MELNAIHKRIEYIFKEDNSMLEKYLLPVSGEAIFKETNRVSSMSFPPILVASVLEEFERKLLPVHNSSLPLKIII